MTEKEILLSVIIISHEQREQLKRCVNSVLDMHLPFTFELIISDDRSKDGTYELAKSYADSLEEYQVDNPNLVRIVAIQCNSDYGKCVNNSQRSGYNRCNAYPYAKGKYIAHADGDDFYMPAATVFVREVSALEDHPECAIAMANCRYLNDGETLDNAVIHKTTRPINDGEIITAKQYIREELFNFNPVMIQRRNPNADPVALYGNRYVDFVTTFHHLQFGSIVYVDVADYVYVSYPTSVVHQLAKQCNDKAILWNMGIYISNMMPMFMRDMYMSAYYQSTREVIKMALSGYKLQVNNYLSLKGLHLWIYDCFARDLNMWDKMRLKFTDMWMKMIKITGWESDLNIRILNALLTKYV